MAPTTSAGGVPNNVLGTYQGASLVTAFPQVTPNKVGSMNLDILQITVPGTEPGMGNSPTPIVALNVDYAGVVHNPAVSPTDGTRAGVYHAIDRTTSSSVAQLFASAWRWNSTVGQGAQSDIVQVVNIGGNISYWLDYLGVAHGS